MNRKLSSRGRERYPMLIAVEAAVCCSAGFGVRALDYHGCSNPSDRHSHSNAPSRTNSPSARHSPSR